MGIWRNTGYSTKMVSLLQVILVARFRYISPSWRRAWQYFFTEPDPPDSNIPSLLRFHGIYVDFHWFIGIYVNLVHFQIVTFL